MASIRKDTSRGLRVYWTLHLPGNKSKDKSKSCKSKMGIQSFFAEASKLEHLTRMDQATVQDLQHAVNIGLITSAEMALLTKGGWDGSQHYLEELRPDYEMQSKATSASLHSHKSNLSKGDILEEEFKGISILGITKEHIEQFIAKRRGDDISNGTINHDLKALRKYLDIAVSKAWLKENPAYKVTLLPEEKNRIPRCLYPLELESFAAKLKEMSYLLYGDVEWVMKLLLLTGMRRSELVKLKPDNIKLELNQIHILGKGKKNRIVGIHADLVGELTARVKKGQIVPKLYPDSITSAFRKIIKAAGLSKALTLHSLRHSYITYLLEGGTPIGQVRDRAGHSSLETTNRYTHAIPTEFTLENNIKSPWKS